MYIEKHGHATVYHKLFVILSEAHGKQNLGVGGPQHLVEGRQTAHVQQVVFGS